jgi:hypothetical protein
MVLLCRPLVGRRGLYCLAALAVSMSQGCSIDIPIGLSCDHEHGCPPSSYCHADLRCYPYPPDMVADDEGQPPVAAFSTLATVDSSRASSDGTWVVSDEGFDVNVPACTGEFCVAGGIGP